MLSMILASAFAISVSAQAPQAATPPTPNDVDDVQRSQVVLGLPVELTDQRGGKVKGTLARVDFDGPDVLVRTKGGDVTVPKSSLRRVERVDTHRLGASTAYGALLGLSAGVGISYAMYSQVQSLNYSGPFVTAAWTSNDPNVWTMQDTVTFVGLATAIGTAIGLAVDLRHPGRKHTIFVAPMPGAAKSVTSKTGTPMLARDKGVRVGYRLTF